jgi:hypothetical protein
VSDRLAKKNIVFYAALSAQWTECTTVCVGGIWKATRALLISVVGYVNNIIRLCLEYFILIYKCGVKFTS